MTYNIIASGSSGNAVIINDSILIDCGVSFKKLEPYIQDLRIVLLTHEHGDHFKAATVKRLAHDRPALRWGCCEWMKEPLLNVGVKEKAIDVYRPWFHSVYNGLCTVCPTPLPHDVPNCGYRIEFENGERLYYATDCATLDEVSAPNYDLYMIEANHTRAEIETKIAAKRAAGKFSYEMEAIHNHLSQEQALEWLAANMGPKSRYIFMHQHVNRGGNRDGMV